MRADGTIGVSYYDLLASECRLASFLAVAKGDVPQSHWFRLGRTLAATESGYPAAVRELEASSTGLDADLWKLLAEDIGLAGVGLPEEVGGLGGLAELLAVAEELGATLAPVPFVSSTVLCGQVLASCGDDAAPYLERVAGGEIAGAALTDDRGTWSPDRVSCAAA